MNVVDLQLLCYVEYDASGRITQTGHEPAFLVQMAMDAGRPRLTIPARNIGLPTGVQPEYVDLSGPNPRLRDRPIFTWGFDRDTVLPRQEAVMREIPACTVQFTGPVNGSQDHSAGDLSIGFTVPGAYTITFEAFPYQPVSLPLTVVKSLPAAKATAAANVKV